MYDFTKLVHDLDRCVHGRHEGEKCGGCEGGRSAGNPHLRPGMTIGYTLDGTTIVVPPSDHLRYTPGTWVRA